MDRNIAIHSRAKVMIVAGLLVLFVLAYGPLFPILGFSTGMLVTAPVMAIAWFFGARGGVVAGILTYPLNGLLVTFLTDANWMDMSAGGGLIGSSAEVFVGFLVGRLRDLMARASEGEKARIGRATAVARAEELRRSRERMIEVSESVRKETARYLHSSVQSKLIVALHQLQEARKALASGKASENLDQAQKTIGELVNHDIQAISERLYPSILRRGLVPAMETLRDQFESELHVEIAPDQELVSLEHSNTKTIPEKVKLAAYRIAEDALTNVVKHAKASKVSVALQLEPEVRLRLSVRDDGSGFRMDKAPDGIGINAMRDYADAIGGETVIHSAPGTGTQVIAVLPLQK